MGRWRKLNRISKFVTIAATVLVCVGAFGILFYLSSCPLPEDSEPVCVLIGSGSSTRQIGELLYQSGLVRNPYWFRIVARVTGADGAMKAGEYCFESGMFVWDVIADLREGKVIYHPFTIPEGLCVEEIAEVLSDKGVAEKEAFLELAKNPDLVSSFASTDELQNCIYPVEGYLFPDTYLIQKGTSEQEIMLMMLNRFSEVFTPELQDKAREHGLSIHQAATLASIVEKEAVVDEERPVIAGVYINRLNIGMKLDVDPTVLYALGRYKGTLLWKDLEVDSLYNTYKYIGLPPGPICNFGKASLEAVLDPADVDYLYFVSKNDGTHAFARTFSEHQQNVRIYQGD
jgi:UPF0755 protein